MTEAEPMELDDHVENVEPAKAEDADGIPYCRKHHCRMKQASGGKKNAPTAYYACPVPKCDEKSQKIKSKVPGVVPSNPQLCPRCTTKKRPTYCERDADRSTAASVILRCPGCGWKSGALAVPQLAAAHFARRPSVPVENVGDR